MANTDSTAGIRPLPPGIAAQIKSATAIASTADAVIGLLKNSLDAHSTKITVLVDFKRRTCTVEDNGLGIHPAGFEDGLCKPHHTSKPIDIRRAHGGRGTFLASLAALSLLSVTSKHSEHLESKSLLVHRGHVLQRKLPTRSGSKWRRDGEHGTVVTARDILGNVPVRTKHSSLVSDYEDKEWRDLNITVAALVLAWPYHVSVSLEGQSPSNRCHFGPPRTASQDHNDKFSTGQLVARTTSVLRSLPGLEHLRSTLVPATARTSAFAIRGVISTEPQPTKRYQFISWGVKPVRARDEEKVLYDAVNHAFTKSWFGLESSLSDDQAAGRRRSDLRTERKGVDRWPLFSLSVEPRGAAAHNLDTTHREELIKILRNLADQWLEVNGFRTRRDRSASSASTTAKPPIERGPPPSLKRSLTAPNEDSRSKRQKLSRVPSDTADAFGDWSRLKGGDSSLRRAIWSAPTSRKSQEDGQDAGSGTGGPRPRSLGAGDLVRPSNVPMLDSHDDADGEVLEWQPPRAGKPTHISRRTGMLVDSKRTSTSDDECNSIPGSKEHLATANTGNSASNAKNWLSDALKGWENPIYSHESTCSCDHNCTGEHPGGLTDVSIQSQLDPNAHAVQLTKDGLASARVISQIDRKYILVSIPHETQQSTLAIIDQHAASERCIVEQLLEGMFDHGEDAPPKSTIDGSPAGLHTSRLSKSVHFQLTEQEASTLRSRAAHFAQWGILYDLGASHRVTVTHLPPVIAERCTQVPKLLIELIRRELHDPVSQRPRPVAAGSSWLSRLGFCPRGILDMVDSRACRSAVMFNDELSPEECQALVARLARCAFPFICAHGRVGVVPLLCLPQTRGPEEQGVASRWKRWASKS